ncbi:MAG: DUF4336 domain-containing protein [Cyanobacteria bacterium REEB498]|nr:DUF4336 domain-containing protein [Cyanobacteria bacterium REEB498]
MPLDQFWPWWPLLPLYPYGRRRTLVRELIPGQLWSFEQLQGVFYVAVPIRMTVVRVWGGLLLYAPVAPTAEVRRGLGDLEARFGPVRSIVLPTASGLEHKLPVPAMARAFPAAEVWVTPGQWSFPLNLPSSWLGFPRGRTRVLGEQGFPHPEELQWLSLGPLDLGLGRFQEFSCLQRSSGALLITDALVAINPEPPEIFNLDPTPLLFHARDRGDQPLADTPELRLKGWQRLALFASYLRPEALQVPSPAQLLGQAFRPGCRNPRSYFGIYPFQWSRSSAAVFAELQAQAVGGLQVAPVLERLVFPRARALLLAWLRELQRLPELRWLVPAHYDAPVPCSPEQLRHLADALEQRPWAPDRGDWGYLAGIDALLLRSGVVPERPLG